VFGFEQSFFRRKEVGPEALSAFSRSETSTRKIILPIWKDVNRGPIEGIRPYWDRRCSVRFSRIDKVVEEIKVAVRVSKAQDEIARLLRAAESKPLWEIGGAQRSRKARIL